MRFRSPGNDPIQVSLTSGHTAVIPPEGCDLDPLFHREAISRGAIPEGVGHAEVKGEAPFNRMEVIAKTIKEMIDEGREGDFTGDGKPDVRKLTGRCGFGVTREERDEAWASLDAELSE